VQKHHLREETQPVAEEKPAQVSETLAVATAEPTTESPVQVDSSSPVLEE
jgi:hypothetical protein